MDDEGLGPAGAQASPAKLTDRFLAYCLDAAPFAAGYWTALRLVGRGLPAPLRSWAALPAAWLGLYLLYQAAGNFLGCTAGKWLMDLRVTDLEGRRLGPGRSCLRALGLLLSTPLFNLGFLWAFLQPDSRTWHDLLSGSRVVEARPKSRAESLASALAALLLLASILGAGLWRGAGELAPGELEAVERARAGLNILGKVEEEYRLRNGRYTDSLVELARASGDPSGFRDGMRGLFDPAGVRISAGRDRYSISARALDRMRTQITLSGP